MNSEKAPSGILIRINLLAAIALAAVIGTSCSMRTDNTGQVRETTSATDSATSLAPSQSQSANAPATISSEAILPPNQSNTAVSTTRATSFPGHIQPSAERPWDSAFLNRHITARSGEPIQLELTGGKQASGILENIQIRNGEVTYMDGVMTEPAAGRFFVQHLPSRGLTTGLAGVITFNDNRPGYQIFRSEDGSLTLFELPKDRVICVNYTQPPQNLAEEIPPLNPSTAPDQPIPAYQDGIISLQSSPGAPGVIYLDYRGGRTEGEGWGTFDFEKPNVTSAQIKDVWKRVAEDYLPFTINVTTDIKVYENAAPNSRVRCIMTPTITAAPGAGGVAFVGSWGGGVCWSFYTTGKSAAEVASHEVGHTLGLGHDGRISPEEGYFGGHGSGSTGWAPIMGVGYYQPVVQWSKGEYNSADNSQNDLNTITSYPGAGYRPDDTGDTLATARYLEAFPGNTVSQEGVIERTADTDAFQFTTTGGVASLQARPVNGEWANLALSATLANAAGTIIASNNPQNQLNAAITMSLPAGTYTFRVTGAGRNNPATDGFSSYASLGYYSISGTVTGIRQPSRFTLDESSPNGTLVGTVTGSAGTLNYSIVSGNHNNAFAIDNNGLLTVNNSAALDYEILALNTAFAVQYELFVNITNETTPELTELNRRVVIQIRDVNEAPSMLASTNYILTGTPAETPIRVMGATDPDFFTVLKYSIVGGNASGLFKIDVDDGILRLAKTPTVAETGTHNIAVRVTDSGTSPLNTTVTVQVHVIANNSPFVPGGIAYAVYDGIGGGAAVANLTGNPRFPRDPNWEKIQPTFDSDHDRANDYGSVMRGYVIPPITGVYTFYIASDDNGSLLLSTTTNSASAVQIAFVTGSGGQTWTGPYQWNAYPSQKSASRLLNAGQAYYIEARQKDGFGGDHLSVAWSGPHNGGNIEIIDGVFLAPAYLNYVPHATGFSANVRRDSIQGLRVGQLTITDANTNETTTCTILSGNNEGIFAVDNSGWISIADNVALASTATTSFTLPIRVTDSGSPSLATTATVSLTVIGATNLPTQLQREMFLGVLGQNLADLTGSEKFPSKPDSLQAMTSFNSAQSAGDNYGSRVRALLVPPTTGQYRFWLSSDDAGVLKLSSNASPENASTIASIADGSYSNPNQWTKFPSQMSELIPLVAGQKYYIEALQKENSGGDFVQVAWTGPGLADQPTIIAGMYLQPLDLNFPPSVTGFTTPILQSISNGSVVGIINASDSPLDAIGFEIISGNSNGTFAIDPATGAISVKDNSKIASGEIAAFDLTILAQDSGYGGLYPLKTNLTSAKIVVLQPGEFVEGLKHRYTFTTDGLDSISGAHATLRGSATVANGKLQLPGGSARANCASLNLASTFAANPSLSFEAWCTVTSHQTWSKLWMFGQPNSGAENGLAYVDFTPQTGGINAPSMSFNSNVSTEQNTRAGANPGAMIPGTEYHVLCVYDAPNNQMRLYINGVLADTGSLNGQNISQVPAVEGYLGAAVHYPDPNFMGNINEFRIWNIPLSGLQVALNQIAGPDLVLSASSADVTVLNAPSTNLNAGETVQAQAVARFGVIDVPATQYATNWISSNPAVVAVNANGLITAISDGSATISATVAGATGSLEIQVGQVPPQFTKLPESQTRYMGETAVFESAATGNPIAFQWNRNTIAIPGATNATLTIENVTFADGADYSVTISNSAAQFTSAAAHLTIRSPELLHRWTFNDGSDSVGGANATLIGAATFAGGQLHIPGGPARANGASVNLEATLATNANLSVEAWFTLNGLQEWSKLWMFGRANGGVENEFAYIDFTPRTDIQGNVPSMAFNSITASEQNTRGGLNPATLVAGSAYHVMCVFDSAADQMRLYINGTLADVGSMAGGNISQLNANEMYFGAAVHFGDLNLLGSIDEIRIWSTPLNAALVASSFADGPDTIADYQPVIRVDASVEGGTLTLSWPFGVLEQSDSPTGPWNTVTGAVSPYTPETSAPEKFYRIRAN